MGKSVEPRRQPSPQASTAAPDTALVLAIIAALLLFFYGLLGVFVPRTISTADAQYDNTIDALNLIVAASGIVLALVSYWWNTGLSRQQSRMQHTYLVLFEVRLSEEFRIQSERRKATFPEYDDIDFRKWRAALRGPDAREREGAQALSFMLNYYEFIALGIQMGDLDEEMLRRSVRGIMCNLVDDARFVIAGVRETNNLGYAYLCWLYDRWRRDDINDIHGNPTERPIPDRLPAAPTAGNPPPSA